MYISELAKNSFTLQKLNEQFRHIAPRLDIVSFYETQSTAIGVKNARVVWVVLRVEPPYADTSSDDTGERLICTRVSGGDIQSLGCRSSQCLQV